MLIPQADSKTKAHGLPPRSQDAPASWVHLVSSASNYSSARSALGLDFPVAAPQPRGWGRGLPQAPGNRQLSQQAVRSRGDRALSRQPPGDAPACKGCAEQVHNKCMLRELSSACPEWERNRLSGRAAMPVGGVGWGEGKSWASPGIHGSKTLSPGANSRGGRTAGRSSLRL